MCVFVSQRLEEQEKESVNAGRAVKLVKGKVGKPKVKKMHLEETLPSPFGRRIEPQVTQAMKADASKKLSKKKKVNICVCVCVCHTRAVRELSVLSVVSG